MNNNTYINYEAVKNDANNMKEYSNAMANIFEEFETTMRSALSDEYFQGLAADTTENSYNTLKSKFNSYTDLVIEFANMITTAQIANEETESEIARRAENL